MGDIQLMPIAEISFADVVDFCKVQRREDIRLDYKEELPRTDKLAKLIASFANTQGGLAVFGVKEVADGLPEANPEGRDLGADPRQTVRNVAGSEIWPPVILEVSPYIPNPSNVSRGFLVVRVPYSADVPHTVDGRKGIYVRVNDSSIPLAANVDQIAFMLQRRDRTAEFQRSQRGLALDRLANGLLLRNPKGLLQISIGPLLSRHVLLPPDQLAKSAIDLCSKSGIRDRSLPVGNCRATASHCSIGWYHHGYNTAVHLDCFGNVSMAELVGRNVPVDKVDYHDVSNLKEHLDSGATDVCVAHCGEVAARVIACVGSARNFFRNVGFNGPLEAEVAIRHAANVWLGLWIRDLHLPGGPPLEDSIKFTASVKIAMDDDDTTIQAIPLLAQLAWAWGWAVPDGGEILAQYAEIYSQDAANICPKCGNAGFRRSRGACIPCYLK